MAQPIITPQDSQNRPSGELIHLPFVDTRKTWVKLLPWMVFGLSAIVLGWFAAPGVTFHDSGEFALAAKVGGIPHPPGSPTWTLLAWIATSIFSSVDAARVTNLLGSVYAAGSLGLVTWLAQTWIRKSFDDLPHSIIALAAPLVLLASPAFLEQAFVTEQYTLLLFLNLCILTLATKGWVDGSLTWKGWMGLGLLMGLACGNHPSQIVLGPLMLAISIGLAGKGQYLKPIGCGLAGILLGLSVYLYNPIRSATSPIMNWGQPDNWDRFFWGISRQQWASRGFNEAPPGFAEEWMRSFALPTHVGWIALLFAVPGLVVMARRAGKPLLWLALTVVPYAAVLLLGHMKQAGMDSVYVRFYGVIDWHLPVYALFALGAAFGLAQLSDVFQSHARDFFSGIVVAILGALALVAIPRESMREDTSALDSVKNMFLTVPQNGLLFLASDNTSHSAAYAHYGQGLRPDLFVGYGYPQYQGAQDDTFVWGPRIKRQWLETGMHNWKMQPLSLPKLTEKDFSRPLFVEYPNAMPGSAAFLLPAGWVWELKDKPITNEAVLRADEWVKASHPELFAEPAPGTRVHRLTREGYSQAHQRRGNYFSARRLYGSAIESFTLALKWQPENPQIWMGLGFAYQMAKKPTEAAEAYARAAEILPTFPGPNGALGLLALEAGRMEDAGALLMKEVEINPTDKAALANLERFLKSKGKASSSK